jgi:hypothetical protein
MQRECGAQFGRENESGATNRPRLQPFRVYLLAAEEVGKQLGRLRLAVEGLVAE